MSTVKVIQTAIQTAYAAISLPNGLGAPTSALVEPDGGIPSVPYVVVYRGRAVNITHLNGGSYQIQREYFARLFTAKFTSDTPSAIETKLENAADCIEAVEDYFMLSDDRLNRTKAVTQSIVSADTADTVLEDRNNDTFAGVTFRHLVTYTRTTSTT